MNEDLQAQIESIVNVTLFTLVAVLGFPALLYFVLQRVTGAETANIAALGASVVAAVIVIYVIYTRRSE